MTATLLCLLILSVLSIATGVLAPVALHRRARRERDERATLASAEVARLEARLIEMGGRLPEADAATAALRAQLDRQHETIERLLLEVTEERSRAKREASAELQALAERLEAGLRALSDGQSRHPASLEPFFQSLYRQGKASETASDRLAEELRKIGSQLATLDAKTGESLSVAAAARAEAEGKLLATLRQVQDSVRESRKPETPQSRHWGVLLFAQGTDREPVWLAHAGSSPPGAKGEVQLTLPRAIQSGALLVAWGPATLGPVRVADDVALNVPAPVCQLPRPHSQGQKIVIQIRVSER